MGWEQRKGNQEDENNHNRMGVCGCGGLAVGVNLQKQAVFE